MKSLFTLLLSLVCSYSLLGAESADQKSIKQKIEELQDSKEPADIELKKKWQTVLSQLNAIESNKSATTALTKDLKALKNNKSSDKQVYQLDKYEKLPSKLSFDDLSEKVEEIKGILSSAQAEKSKIEQQVSNDQARLQLIPKELGAAKANLSLIDSKSTVETELVETKLATSLKRKLESSIAKLEVESKLLEARDPQLRENLASVDTSISEIQQILKLWSNALDKENRKRAETIKINAESLMVQLADHPQLKSFAEINLKLVNQILESDNVSSQVKSAENKLTDLEATLFSLKEQQNYAKERLKLLKKAKMQIDRTTGQLLRDQRDNLPSEKELQSELKLLLQRSTSNEVAILELKTERDLLPKDITAFLKTLSLKEGDGLPTKDNARELIESCDTLYSTLLKQRKTLSDKQAITVTLLENVISNSKQYTSFLDTRLLWIVSHTPINGQTFIEEAKAVQTLLAPSALYVWGTKLKNDWSSFYPLWICMILVLATLLTLRSKFKKLLPLEHDKASKRFCISITPTLKAIGFETALALPIPLVLGLIGWRSPSSSAIGSALITTAIFLFVTLLLRSMTREKGLAVSHFDLREEKRKIIRNTLNLIIPIMVPLLFLTQGTLGLNDGDGRILTTINLIVMGVAMHLLLWPKKQLLAKNSAGIICYAAYLFFAVFPFLLAIATAVGYFVSVLTLRLQLINSIRVILIVTLISAIITRWLLISRRRIASKTALESRKEVIEETPEAKLAQRQELRAKLEQITEVTDQSSKLVKVAVVAALFFGLNSIWSNTLPALNVLDGQELWTTTSSAPAESTSTPLIPSGETKEVTETPDTTIVSVTLQDLLVSVIILVITYIAATNIPGLLRMTILDRINLKTGAAFGFTTVVRYVIVIVGIVWAFNNIAITWDKVQWIAAAVTLGIGFGLQEIFANFVAGLILLFERPVRIGDLVTIGGVNGKVSKIQMRATTILQFNNRELIVPNKEFITGQLVNWTLSDNIMRAEVVVGIAYGSDTELAKKLLLECAANNSRVLQKPESDVIFTNFGGSSLDFKIRVFVKSVDDLVPVQSELHFDIDKAFREANIEIAFPQQDIHIRSIEATLPIEKASSNKASE